MNLNYSPRQGLVAVPQLYQTLQVTGSLSDCLQSIWQLHVPAGHFSYRAVPDNCIDWIISCENPDDNYLIRPFAAAKTFSIEGPATYFALRFSILGYSGLIAAPVAQWSAIDEAVSAQLLMSHAVYTRVLSTLDQRQDFGSRCQAISRHLLAVLKRPKTDHRLQRYIHYCFEQITLAAGDRSVNFSERQCAEFGLSSRQLRRLTRLYLNLTPSEFSRIIRFQTSLIELSKAYAFNSGAMTYYDQAHFVREFKRMAGVTPNKFRTMSVLYNTDVAA